MVERPKPEMRVSPRLIGVVTAGFLEHGSPQTSQTGGLPLSLTRSRGSGFVQSYILTSTQSVHTIEEKQVELARRFSTHYLQPDIYGASNGASWPV
jgi:hypothetical protein